MHKEMIVDLIITRSYLSSRPGWVGGGLVRGNRRRSSGETCRRTIEEGLTLVEYSYTVLFEPAEEGGLTVTCPALAGLVTEGDTLDEARAMAQDAIRGHIEPA